MKKFLVVIALFVFMLMNAQGAMAQDTSGLNEEDRKAMERGKLIADFLDTAFSNQMWTEDVKSRRSYYFNLNEAYKEPQLSVRSNKSDLTNLRDRMPWVAQSLSYESPLPRRGVANKWPAEVSVGIDWPLYPSGFQEVGGRIPDHLRDIVEDQLSVILPQVSEAIKSNIDYIPYKGDKDSTKEYARMRILLLGSQALLSRSFSSLGSEDSFGFSPLQYEQYFWSAVLYRDSSDVLYMGDNKLKYSLSDVNTDGYFFPSADNNIYFSVCKIVVGGGDDVISEQALRARVNKCVLRSLGLPNTRKDTPNSLLSGDVPDEDNVSTIPKEDLDLLSVLYCPHIKSGMDKNAVLKIFAEGKCL